MQCVDYGLISISGRRPLYKSCYLNAMILLKHLISICKHSLTNCLLERFKQLLDLCKTRSTRAPLSCCYTLMLGVVRFRDLLNSRMEKARRLCRITWKNMRGSSSLNRWTSTPARRPAVPVYRPQISEIQFTKK